MNVVNESKINKLLRLQPNGVVLTSKWLHEQGYSPGLLRTYRNSNWLQSIGRGAMKRFEAKVDYFGAIHALQNQLNLSIHPAAKTALAVWGKTHYLNLIEKEVCLFGLVSERLPAWFKNYDWGLEMHYFSSGFLPAKMGLVEKDHENFSVKVSSPARAMMECLYLTPQRQELFECFEIMQGLNNLSPASVQELLENCTSVKVKRLFLYIANKAGHNWVKHIRTDKIELGSGKRSIVADGAYVANYQITVPRELEVNENSGAL